VIRTARGHTLAVVEREDVALLGGYQATGRLHAPGRTVLMVEGHGAVPVFIERSGAPLEQAIAAFEERCPDASIPLTILKSAPVRRGS
jgi:hypothetical protein